MAVDTTVPWYMGGNGATNLTRGEAQKRAREILESAEYKDSITRRIKADELPAGVEVAFWHYAYGKPMEQVELTMKQVQEDLSQLSVDQLLERARAVSDALQEASVLEAALPTTTHTVQ